MDCGFSSGRAGPPIESPTGWTCDGLTVHERERERVRGALHRPSHRLAVSCRFAIALRSQMLMRPNSSPRGDVSLSAANLSDACPAACALLSPPPFPPPTDNCRGLLPAAPCAAAAARSDDNILRRIYHLSLTTRRRREPPPNLLAARHSLSPAPMVPLTVSLAAPDACSPPPPSAPPRINAACDRETEAMRQRCSSTPALTYAPCYK